jgi:oligopeptide/dipeptide ABC transporter ATP-binding protein
MPPAAIYSIMAELLRVEDLVVRYRALGPLAALLAGVRDPFVDAVLEVSFALAAGTTLGIVGESGSGKSTLARAIMGLVRPTAGAIDFDGMSPTARSDAALRPYRRHIAMMFQDPLASLSPRLTVQSLITEPFRIHGVAARDLAAPDLRDQARRLLAMVGLDPSFAARYPHQLSGGQARRVGVARALALSPKLVIADEPTAGLDVSAGAQILNLMNDLQERLGLTYLVITHNLTIVDYIADRLAVMYLGKLSEVGPTERILDTPAHPYTHALLSAVSEPDPRLRRGRGRLLPPGEIPSPRNPPPGCRFHTRCPFAEERSRTEVPELEEIAPGHLVACHFWQKVRAETTREAAEARL